MGKKALMVIAPGEFRDEELLKPRRVLEEAGVEVTVASTVTEEVKGMLGTRLTPDVLLSEVDAADYDAVIFVGGGGAKVYWDDPAAHNLAKAAAERGTTVGAICIAPVILDRAGVLEGKQATVFSSSVRDMRSAQVVKRNVVVDGGVVTANGPQAAEDFGRAVLEQIQG